MRTQEATVACDGCGVRIDVNQPALDDVHVRVEVEHRIAKQYVLKRREGADDIVEPPVLETVENRYLDYCTRTCAKEHLANVLTADLA